MAERSAGQPFRCFLISANRRASVWRLLQLPVAGGRSRQQRAHEWKLEGATVAERYYGSASATPSTAFGILWRLHLHHLKKLRSLGGKHVAAAIAIEQKITGICALLRQTEEMKQRRLPPSLPRVLDLQAQGRFALGYYQQKAEDRAGQQAAAKSDETKNDAKSGTE